MANFGKVFFKIYRFKPARCSNPQCQNRSKFQLDVQESTFIDFQVFFLSLISSKIVCQFPDSFLSVFKQDNSNVCRF